MPETKVCVDDIPYFFRRSGVTRELVNLIIELRPSLTASGLETHIKRECYTASKFELGPWVANGVQGVGGRHPARRALWMPGVVPVGRTLQRCGLLETLKRKAREGMVHMLRSGAWRAWKSAPIISRVRARPLAWCSPFEALRGQSYRPILTVLSQNYIFSSTRSANWSILMPLREFWPT